MARTLHVAGDGYPELVEFVDQIARPLEDELVVSVARVGISL